MGPGGMGWMWLWWLLILVGVVAIAFGLTRAGRAGGARSVDGTGSEPPVSTARQILDERLARGEIDEEEYRARRRLLDG